MRPPEYRSVPISWPKHGRKPCTTLHPFFPRGGVFLCGADSLGALSVHRNRLRYQETWAPKSDRIREKGVNRPLNIAAASSGPKTTAFSTRARFSQALRESQKGIQESPNLGGKPKVRIRSPGPTHPRSIQGWGFGGGGNRKRWFSVHPNRFPFREIGTPKSGRIREKGLNRLFGNAAAPTRSENCGSRPVPAFPNPHLAQKVVFPDRESGEERKSSIR